MLVDGDVTIKDCVIRGHLAGEIVGANLAGLLIDGGSPLVRDAVVADNSINGTVLFQGDSAVGLVVTGGAPVVQDSEIARNALRTIQHLDENAMSGVFVRGGDLDLRRTEIHHNSTITSQALGLYTGTGVLVASGDLSLVEVLVRDNLVDAAPNLTDRSTISCLGVAGGATVTAEHVTWAGNRTQGIVGAGSACIDVSPGATLELTNSIVKGNLSTATFGEDYQVVSGVDRITATYSNLPDVQGTGNIDLPPAYTDPSAGDYTLSLRLTLDRHGGSRRHRVHRHRRHGAPDRLPRLGRCSPGHGRLRDGTPGRARRR